MQDKTIKCGCGKDFVFRVKDQVFFKKMVDEGKFKGPYTEPRKCQDCRLKRKMERDTKEIQNASPFKSVLDQMKMDNRRGSRNMDDAIDDAVRPRYQIDEDEYRHEKPVDPSSVTPGEDR